MKKKLRNVLEIGASSMLDFDFKSDKIIKRNLFISWTKCYRNNKPKYYTKLEKLDTISSDNSTLRRCIYNTDVIIYSIGNKGPRSKFEDYSPDEVMESIKANLGIILDTLPRVIKSSKSSTSPKKVIFLGSVAGKEGNTYPNHAMYSAMKSALRALVDTIKVENSMNRNLQFIHLEIPYTSSRMTGGKGDSPDEIRSKILDIINS